MSGVLSKLHSDPGQAAELKIYVFDAEHEKKRKEQLNRLWARTPEQVEEEEYLRSELRKIEARKKEREKKTQDLQKLITAADGGTPPNAADLLKKTIEAAKKSNSAKKKSGKSSMNPKLGVPGIPDIYGGIKWSDFKSAGTMMRSARMKLPSSVGQKKIKAIESMLAQHSVDHYQMPTEEICSGFNELRSDMVLQYELTCALQSLNVEMHTLKHQYENLKAGETLEIPKEIESLHLEKIEPKDEIGIVPSRKRKAALEQSNVLKKLKQKL
jgi:DNA methyltransferase 1-associated protein 1